MRFENCFRRTRRSGTSAKIQNWDRYFACFLVCFSNNTRSHALLQTWAQTGPQWAQNVPDNVNVHPVCQSCAAKLQFEICSRLNRLELPFVFATAPLAPSNDGARSLAFESRQ